MLKKNILVAIILVIILVCLYLRLYSEYFKVTSQCIKAPKSNNHIATSNNHHPKKLTNILPGDSVTATHKQL